MKRNENKKYHYIYKVVRTTDGKYYLGMHSTDDLSDGYLGSGTMLWHSIRKYGRDAHNITILEFLPDRKSLSLREKQLVNEEVIKDPMSFNMRVGGNGGDCTYSSGPLSEEHKQKVSVALKGKKKPEGFGEKVRKALIGRTMTEDQKQKMSDAKLGKPTSYKQRKAVSNGMIGKKHTEDRNKRKSERMRGKPNLSGKKLQKPCTVDGIMIYPSVSALVTALGHGKNGVKSPNFRFVS